MGDPCWLLTAYTVQNKAKVCIWKLCMHAQSTVQSMFVPSLWRFAPNQERFSGFGTFSLLNHVHTFRPWPYLDTHILCTKQKQVDLMHFFCIAPWGHPYCQPSKWICLLLFVWVKFCPDCKQVDLTHAGSQGAAATWQSSGFGGLLMGVVVTYLASDWILGFV